MDRTMNLQAYSGLRGVSCAVRMVPDSAANVAAVICMIIGIILPIIILQMTA